MPAGRADVLSASHAYEVEPVTSWRKGAQQAYAYGAMSGLTSTLAVFGHSDNLADYLPIIEAVMADMVGLELWIYDHSAERWLPCDAETVARIRTSSQAHADMGELTALTAEIIEIRDLIAAEKAEAEQLVIELLRAGVPPTVVADASPFSAAKQRILARAAGIPPAKKGGRKA